MNKEQVVQWISVKEKMPDHIEQNEDLSKVVLVTVILPDGSRCVGVDHTYRNKWHTNHADCFKVTHWMPLPEPCNED